jgi:hypothetical protein
MDVPSALYLSHRYIAPKYNQTACIQTECYVLDSPLAPDIFHLLDPNRDRLDRNNT